MHRLPPSAQRLARARQSDVRTSLLSASSAAGIAAVGFEPVGEAMGCVVRTPAVRKPLPNSQYLTNFDRHSEPYVAGLRAGFHDALRRLREEATGLHADGVVDVRLTRTDLGGADEFVALGTAVRARSKARPRSPFTTDLCGGDVAKLMLSGWVPVQLAWAGAAHARSKYLDPQLDELRPHVRLRARLRNYEVELYTELVTNARASARNTFHGLIRLWGADTGLVSEMSLSTWEPAEKIIAAIATVQGTVIARFRSPGPAPSRTLTVIPLGQSAGSRCPNAGQ